MECERGEIGIIGSVNAVKNDFVQSFMTDHPKVHDRSSKGG